MNVAVLIGRPSKKNEAYYAGCCVLYASDTTPTVQEIRPSGDNLTEYIVYVYWIGANARKWQHSFSAHYDSCENRLDVYSS